MAGEVDALIAKSAWVKEMAALRRIALGCGLDEAIKWGQPCYQSQGRNVVLIHGFKEYCALLFMKGALMADPHGLLVQQTDNVRSARQIRFTGLAEIEGREEILAGYIREAVAVEASGAKIVKKTAGDMPWPDELRDRLDASAELAEAFARLTPGRQRAYLLHFAAAKQAKTRAARIDKAAPAILAGKGLDD